MNVASQPWIPTAEGGVADAAAGQEADAAVADVEAVMVAEEEALVAAAAVVVAAAITTAPPQDPAAALFATHKNTVGGRACEQAKLEDGS